MTKQRVMLDGQQESDDSFEESTMESQVFQSSAAGAMAQMLSDIK